MSHRWAALVLVLALCAFTPKNAAGQSSKNAPRAQAKGGLGQNYPNPFNPETRIPFTVECSAGDTRLHVVTLQVINTLAQVVTVPTFEAVAPGSIGTAPSGVSGRPI